MNIVQDDKINERLLKEYIRQTVKSVVNEVLLNEMAFALKDYKERIRNHAVEIARNWCLVRYTYYDENFLQLRKHWMNELKTHLTEITIAKVKGKNQEQTKYNTFLNVWSEFEFDRDEYSINGQIANKFEDEGIDIMSDDYACVICDFKNAVLDLAKTVASGERQVVNEYVNNLCQ